MDMRQTHQLQIKHDRGGDRYMWKQSEINYLKQNYRLPYSELAKHLNRTPHAIDHKLRRLGLPQQHISRRRPSRIYQRHTDQCGGADAIVIKRILDAGTIHIIPTDHTVCDCERAWIAMNFDNARELLAINNITHTRLLNLGATIWNT